MPFSFTWVEYLLVPGTIVLIGGSITFAALKDNKFALSELSPPEKFKIQLSENFSSREKLENQTTFKDRFESILDISEKVTRDPVTFSFKKQPKDPKIDSISHVGITISFVLEPDKNSWKEEENSKFFLQSKHYTIKRWIPKNHDKSKGLPECRYSWESAINDNPPKDNIAIRYLEQIQKFIKESQQNCDPSKTKGMAKTE